jgi:hypothetical protein
MVEAPEPDPSSTEAPAPSLLPVLEQPAKNSADRTMANQAERLNFI